jgi:translation elongation factor EF-Ts
MLKYLNEMVIENDITKRKEIFDKIVDGSMEQTKKELEIPSFMRKGA